MGMKKYWWYVLVVLLVVVLTGTLSYFYFSKQEKEYQDGTLVKIEYVSGEEAA